MDGVVTAVRCARKVATTYAGSADSRAARRTVIRARWPAVRRLRNPRQRLEWPHANTGTACVNAQDPRADVLAIIRRITAAWLDGPPDAIVERVRPCFDNNAVTYGYAPGFRLVARGGDVCARSYEDFVRAATVREFAARDPDVQVTGNTATAVCPWSMTYTLNGETYTESGHEILVFRHDGSDWRVTWRAMLPAPA